MHSQTGLFTERAFVALWSNSDSACLRMRFNCCSSCRISSCERAENTFSIVAACARKIGVMKDFPRGVNATMRILRSWEDSTRLTKPLANNRPLLWTGPHRVCMLFYSLGLPARRVAGHSLRPFGDGGEPVYQTIDLIAVMGTVLLAGSEF